MKKNGIIKGLLIALALSIATIIPVGAATIDIYGHLKTYNPLWSAPYGYASTFGWSYAEAECSVSKAGYETNSVSTSLYEGDLKHPVNVKTSDVYGPTWESAGTVFSSSHSGYSCYGEFQTEYYSISY